LIQALSERGTLRIINRNQSLGRYEIPYSDFSTLFDLGDEAIGSWHMWKTEKRPHIFQVNSRWPKKTNGFWKKQDLGELDAGRFFVSTSSSIITLGTLLSELNRNHFYIMHLSYEGNERERLWNYARRNHLIGLSNSRVPNYWPSVEDQVRDQLDGVWIHQFDLFCKDMELGDIVLMLDGCSRLLGVAKVIENAARYSRRFSRAFFNHVRYVDWIITYDFDNAAILPYSLNKFTNTLSRVDEEKRYWKELTPVKINLAREERTTKNSEILRARRHDGGIESSDHRELKEWIADNPQSIGLFDVQNKKIEYVFPSGDRVDVVFELKNNRYVVVEIETSDALPGCYQALKYKTLKCAELGLPINSSNVQAKVVAWEFEPFIRNFCTRYGIMTHKKKLPSKSNQ